MGKISSYSFHLHYKMFVRPNRQLDIMTVLINRLIQPTQAVSLNSSGINANRDISD